jgi:malate synthase
MTETLLEGISIIGPIPLEYTEILTPQAINFVARLQREFNNRRLGLLEKRRQRQAQIDSGEMPDFLTDTRRIRLDPDWRVAATPVDLQKRQVEITGPTDRKMLINALNSGADVFMADFEDANSPSWANMVEGQINLRNAITGRIDFTSPEGKEYRLNENTAVLMVRPRGWHLVEKHVHVDGEPLSGSLFDFGLFFYHNAYKLLEKGSGPYFYLPKLENHREARLWNDVFDLAQDELSLPRGTIRATVLIENILAAFEMQEILYELREHAAGLNAGRWDYIFSIIKKFRNQPGFVLPDRAQITMTVPFMRAYTELLVKTCHQRGAHAMGGMAAYIPNRKNPTVNETALEKVKEDKLRESRDGFDGTWVAHPDLVPVAKQVFQAALGDNPHQKGRLREDVQVQGSQLIDFGVPDSGISENGLSTNISVALQYLESWLRGTGAVAIFSLMEDTATAEISRAQVWQWIHNPAGVMSDGRRVTVELFRELLPIELNKIKNLFGEELYAQGRFDLAAKIFDALVTAEEFEDFLTLLAYQHLD